MGLKIELYESVVVPTVTLGAETLGFRMDERHELDVIEIRRLRSMCGIPRVVRQRKEEMWRRLSMRERCGIKWIARFRDGSEAWSVLGESGWLKECTSLSWKEEGENTGLVRGG